MTERWVLNASPLIVLARVGQEHLLRALADVLHSLLRIGFRLDEHIIREALSRTVGEKWE